MVYGKLPIKQYAFLCSSDLITGTRGRLVTFNIRKSGLPFGICFLTIRPFPSELHSTTIPFAMLFLCHIQSLTMASFLNVSVFSHTLHEILKSSIRSKYDSLSLANHACSSSKHTLNRIEPKPVKIRGDDWQWIEHKTTNSRGEHWLWHKRNSRRQFFMETTGGTTTVVFGMQTVTCFGKVVR